MTATSVRIDRGGFGSEWLRRIAELWRSIGLTWRISLAVTVGIGVIAAVLMIFRLVPADIAFHLSSATFAVIPFAAGVLIIVAALRLEQEGRLAWSMIGAGVVLWGLGEIVWVTYAWFIRTEVPYPGIADIFYVAAYPVMFVGVLVLPHIRPRRWERIRLTMDAIAGTIAVTAVAWVFYLDDLVYIDPEVGVLEQFINVGYPLGDLLLLVALMILTTRRSIYQFDGRLVTLAAGLIITTVADVAYVVDLDNYFEGNAIDGVWMLAYAVFAFTALLLKGSAKLREQVDRPTSVAALIAPYAAVLTLFAITIVQSQTGVLETATAVAGLLVIARQGVAIRETREIVEKERNDLVASISHELRTPLTAMSGFTEILDLDPHLPTDDRIEMIGIVNTQTQHLTSIVGDLLRVARDDASGLDLRPVDVEVPAIIGSAVGMAARDDGPNVIVDADPSLSVVADEARIRQIVVNFLTNATRYGGGLVRVVARRDDTHAVIEVHDNGPGVARRYEVTIWDRFQRGEHSFRSDVSGSGLGLAIARQIATAHGGSTGYRHSELLGGACFWVRIPLRSTSTKVNAGV